MKKTLAWVLVCAAVSGSNWCGAAPFSITNRVGFDATLNAAADLVEATVNNGFLDPSLQSGFEQSMGKAATSGTTTLIGDRASQPTYFVAGVGGQVGYQGNLSQLGGAGTNQLPAIGAGGQGAVLVGIPASRLGLGKLDNFTFFLNAGTFSTDSKSVHFSMFNIGANAMYQLVPEVGMSLARWGGVRALSGLNFATGNVAYGGHLTQSSGSLSVDMDMDLEVKTTNFMIPLELSTSLQLLYFFQFYAGGSLDFNFGSAKFAGVSSGPVNTGVPGTSATAVLNLDDGTSGSTSLAVLRGFIGGQFNLSVVRLGGEFTQLSNGAKGYGAFIKVGL